MHTTSGGFRLSFSIVNYAALADIAVACAKSDISLPMQETNSEDCAVTLFNLIFLDHSFAGMRLLWEYCPPEASCLLRRNSER